MKKLMKGVLVLIGAMFLLTGCGTKTIDIFDTMDVEFTGADGYGEAELTGIYDFEDEILDNEDSMGMFGTALELESCFRVTIDKKEELSNGDKVTVTVEANNEAAKECGYKFKTGSKTFKVSGLREIQEIDLFENCVITYEGISPFTSITIEDAQEPTSGKTVSYNIQTDTVMLNEFKVGDTFVIRANNLSEEELRKDGYVAKSFTKEYVVEDVPFYPTSIAEIPEDTKKEMRKIADDVCYSTNTEHLSDQEKFLDCEYVGAYYKLTKTSFYYSVPNIYYLLYKVRVENTDGIAEYYWWCNFSNMYVTADGETVVDLSNYSVPSYDSWSGECITIGNYRYAGFADEESMFNGLINAGAHFFNYDIAME